MKRITLGLLILFFVFACLNEASAWFGFKPKDKKDAAPAVSQPASQQASPAAKPAAQAEKAKQEAEKLKLDAEKAKRALIEKRRREINNNEWAIDLFKLSGKGKKEAETIIFKDNQVLVGNFSKRGFAATNYSLSIQGDGTLVWETMQSSEKSGIAFWRGELSSDMQSMRGVLSFQINDKTREEYSFVSTEKKAIVVKAE